MVRRIFNNDALNRSFLENGYVVIDLLNQNQVALLQQLYLSEKFPASGNFYLTVWKDPPEHRLMVHNKVQEIISPAYMSVLSGFKPIISSFAVKLSGSDSAWHLHQDDTFVDERKFVSLSIWLPLVDTDSINGTMRVLPGSHKKYTAPRSPNIPQPFNDKIDDISSHLVDIDLLMGQAIFFDHRLIHSSGPNNSGHGRIAVVTILVPEEADLIYFYLDKSSNPRTIKQYSISEKYYLEAPLGEYSKEPDMDNFRLLETYQYVEPNTILENK